jgi:hypothetical protein
MQSKLENLLKEKERELKLYQRFLDLRAFCEETIFPKVNLPLKDHTEALKGLIERIMPDPKDRTEELFSGEIFVLLCAIYLHDTGFIKHFEWSRNREILNSDVVHHKQLLLNFEIALQLNIPSSAMEIGRLKITARGLSFGIQRYWKVFSIFPIHSLMCFTQTYVIVNSEGLPRKTSS